MKGRPIHERLGFALAGLKAGWCRESSFRIHLRLSVLALVIMLVLQPTAIWWAVVAATMALVLALELINSVLEGVIDLLHPDIHPEIKAAKDMASGAVLLGGFAAMAVTVAVLIEWGPPLWHRILGH